MRRLVGISLVTLTGCLLQNPAYGDHDGATGGTSTGGTSTGGPGSTTRPTGSDGSDGSDGASGTAAPTSGPAATTTGEVTAGTGSTGQADSGSSTGDQPPPVSCPGQEIVATITKDGGFPARDMFVVTTPDPSCQWMNSDHQVLNVAYPCAKQNYGGSGARYTVIGRLNGGHAEYLVAFGIADALGKQGIDPATVAVASARLRIVAWWDMDRGPLSFRVGAIAADDAWVEGNGNPDLAKDGESSWEYRWIENQNAMHAWSDPMGPAAGSAQVATVEVPALTAAEFADHPYYESSEIAGAVVQPWLDPDAERGFVITTDDAPVLVKSKGTNFDPELVLTLCPL